jgi:hypothetical protein
MGTARAVIGLLVGGAVGSATNETSLTHPKDAGEPYGIEGVAITRSHIDSAEPTVGHDDRSEDHARSLSVRLPADPRSLSEKSCRG